MDDDEKTTRKQGRERKKVEEELENTCFGQNKNFYFRYFRSFSDDKIFILDILKKNQT